MQTLSRDGLLSVSSHFYRGIYHWWFSSSLLTVNLLAIISSTGSCQVRCVSLDVATILCIVTSHDWEGPEAWPYARHEQDILAREDKKDQNGFVLAHGGDTLSDPGAYFFL